MMAPGDLIHGLIKFHRTTQVQVGLDTGYHPRHVHKVCSGERNPTAFFVVKFAQSLGIDPEPIWHAISEYHLMAARYEVEREGKRREKNTRAGSEFKMWVASRS